jgi:hypothetical protein
MIIKGKKGQCCPGQKDYYLCGLMVEHGHNGECLAYKYLIDVPENCDNIAVDFEIDLSEYEKMRVIRD